MENTDEKTTLKNSKIIKKIKIRQGEEFYEVVSSF